MNPKRYRPGAFSILVMLAGLVTIVWLKLRRSGLAVTGWFDLVWYLLVPIAAGLVFNLFFARIELDDEAITFIGLLSRKSYRLDEIVKVSTAKGVSARFRLKNGTVVSLPLWVGAEGWGIAAALRHRIRGQGDCRHGRHLEPEIRLVAGRDTPP